MDIFKKKYNSDFNKFFKEHKNKSSLLIEMHQCSCKMVAMIFNSFSSKGPLIMYSNYVRMEGLEILKYIFHILDLVPIKKIVVKIILDILNFMAQ